MKKSLLIFFIFLIPFCLSSQEVLKSTEEEYYDFLSLQGLVERPTLGYRTLSDSVWELPENAEHIWKNNNLGSTKIIWESENQGQNWFTKGFYHGFKYKIYGPEWFNSYNTAAPYGQNDGALWQGRGYNTSLTSGIRAEGFGFELTFKPMIAWSQNREFEYIRPNVAYNDPIYLDNAGKYGYYGVNYIDAPQRFGESNIFSFDLADTEIRYTFHTFTLGFGTENLWLGPAKINPIIHSNNAPGYPKLDLGFRKTSLYMPHFGWYLGDIEFRSWWGKLTESDFFDNDDSNNNNLISGISVNYQLPFFKEFTIGFNRTMLSKWNEINSYSLFNILVPFMQNSAGTDRNDQRASITFDYYNKAAKLDVYFEWGRNDFSPDIGFIIRYPFHTEGWTFGINKSFNLPWFNLKGMFYLEFTKLECSQDYDRLISWYSTFYAHHIITQGYTNRGQWLGAGIGTGGNSQSLGLTVYHNSGNVKLFFQRCNPDLDYTYFIDTRNYPESIQNNEQTVETNIRVFLDFGLEVTQFINKDFYLKGAFIFRRERNPLNISKENGKSWASEIRHNYIFNLQFKYNF